MITLNACNGGDKKPSSNVSPTLRVISDICPDDGQIIMAAPVISGAAYSERLTPSCVTVNQATVRPGEFEVVNAFPELTFNRPVDLSQIPGTNHIVVVGHRGVIEVVSSDPLNSGKTVFLDITTDVLSDNNEMGLVKLTFDPNYTENGYFYIVYSSQIDRVPSDCRQFCYVVSRFKHIEGNPLQADPDSEEVVMYVPEPDAVHNVGDLVFGPDGLLYMSLGDGQWAGDPRNHAQNRTSLLGKILRIDVSNGLPYSIPADNPFVSETNEVAGVIGGGEPIRHEIFAWGFRNPNRFDIDPLTGDIIGADVGQDNVEELNVIRAGGNYGWKLYEGSLPFQPESNTRSDDIEIIAPIIEYNRQEQKGSSITGGVFYYGEELANLSGSYIYGDFGSGNIWALRKNEQDQLIENISLANAGGFSISSFSLINNELYFNNISQNIIQALVSSTSDVNAPPQLLSETGIFSHLRPLTPSAGVIPYDIVTPLWSDDTIKSRWLVLPENIQITFTEDGAWQLPEGAILVKHFAIDLDTTNNSNSIHNLETRLLINSVQGWVGFTYKWNEDQTNATLLDYAFTEDLSINTSNGVVTQQYDYPSPANCTRCHNASAGFVLGPRTVQMNRDVSYRLDVNPIEPILSTDMHRSANQIANLSYIGIFDEGLVNPNDYESHYAALDDDTASLEVRARSYLASNCSHCHNADNALPTSINFRYDDPSEALNAIDMNTLDSSVVPPGLADNAKVIYPSDKSRSTLWWRIQALDRKRMPPLATHKVDTQAVDIIGQWIDSL